jgi:RNA polymerase sigma factor (sigma-70 family)
LASESGVQVLVNSGADSVSHIVMPNQKVGRSWKFQVVPPAPLALGWSFGSFGSVIRCSPGKREMPAAGLGQIDARRIDLAGLGVGRPESQTESVHRTLYTAECRRVPGRNRSDNGGGGVMEDDLVPMSNLIAGRVEPEEERLIARAKAGDQQAYARLLARHQALAFRAAYLVTGSAAEAEDATQEACVKAWLALGRFRSGAPFRPWLVQIAVNEARNRRRAAGRRAGLALRLKPSFTEPDPAPSAETEALAGEQRAQLAAAVARLRADDQLIIAARYFLGLSEAETAIALRLRRGTVKSRLSRALGRLERQLEAMP